MLDLEEQGEAALDASPAGENGQLAPLHVIVADTERRHIRRAIEHTGGSVSRTAEALGISRKTQWEKMRRLGL